MIGLDTNVLARYFVEEADADHDTAAQRQAARQLIESGQALFLPKTVALELEWVLRGYYGFAVESVLQVFDQLLHHPCLSVEARPDLEQALAGLRSGDGPVRWALASVAPDPGAGRVTVARGKGEALSKSCPEEAPPRQ